MFFFDPLYFVFALPALALGIWAQFKVRNTFQKYAQVPTSSGMTGVDALGRLGYSRGITGLDTAKLLMRRTGISLNLANVPGELTDHYDPRTKTIALSDSSQHNSVAAVAVVAHEFGHAMQDAQNYAPLKWRGALVPAVTAGSWIGPIILMAGFFIGSTSLIWLGVIGFALTALFSLITLPVEFDASKRALALLQDNNILVGDELGGAKKVLDAAALTYVAAATSSVMTLLYYVFRLTGMSRSEE